MNALRLNSSMLARLLAALAVVTLAGCAGTQSGATASDGAPSAGRSGVEVFGTIDAGVSRTVNKSERR